MSRRALGLLLIAACAACGQVGPLHLPQDAPDNEGYLFVRKKSEQAPVNAPAEAPPAGAAPASR